MRDRRLRYLQDTFRPRDSAWDRAQFSKSEALTAAQFDRARSRVDSAGGRILAALVMLLGIGFITVITAAITSTFVAESGTRRRSGSGDPSAQQLGRIEERLERIEAALRERR